MSAPTRCSTWAPPATGSTGVASHRLPGVPPLEHFPPGFTLLLAGLGKLGVDPLTGARVVNALAFAGIVLLVGVVVRRPTGSVPAGVVAAVLAAAASDLLALSASALSEPLFILLGVAGLALLAAYLDQPRPALLAGASALVAAAFLTRYVGIALIVAGVAGLLWRRRWVAAGVFGMVTVAPVAAFLLWAGPSDRSVVVHMFGADYLGQAVRPLARWVVPWPGPPAGAVLAVVLVVYRARRLPVTPANWLLVAFAVAYVGLLLANRAFTDATGRLDARFLAPLHIVAILLVVPALHRLKPPALAVAGALGRGPGRRRRGVDRRRPHRRQHPPAGLHRRRPGASALVATAGEPLHTNAPDAVSFLAGRPGLAIPPRRTTHRQAQPGLCGRSRRHARLPPLLRRHHLRTLLQPTRAKLEALLMLKVVAQDEVGTL